MKIKGCLFDMDGVIVDTAKHHFTAWLRLANVLGISFSEKENRALKGLSRIDSLERILSFGSMELDSKTKVMLMDKKNKIYLSLVESMGASDVLPGVKEFILDLRSQGVGICLGSSSRNASTILKSIGLTDLFDGVVDGNNITLSKPDPEVFLRGARLLNLPPESCVVFEDASAGIDAAIKGGFFALGVGGDDSLSHANAIVPNLDGMTFEKLQSLVEANI